jgi:hypothetical protein
LAKQNSNKSWGTLPAFLLKELHSRFETVGDFESSVAYFFTHVPFVAPKAYLNILYKPAPVEVQTIRCNQLGITGQLREFYSRFNGALFFSGAIRIFGFRHDKYLLERSDWKTLPPINISEINERNQPLLDEMRLVCFADYDLDCSSVYLNRDTGAVACYEGRRLESVRSTWASFQDWLQMEFARVSICFDRSGHLLVDEESLLPGPGKHKFH